MGLWFNRRWRWLTLLTLAALAVLIRLGVWQLERLEQRRAFNARVTAQLEQPALNLSASTLTKNLTGLEYRAATVTGVYGFSQQVALRNQVYNGQLGVHLLTPLIISGTETAVLINRGWVPAEATAPEQWRAYDEPGTVEVSGRIRLSQNQLVLGGMFDVQGPSSAWNQVNVERIGQQIDWPLLPVYIQQTPTVAEASLPARAEPPLDLSDGPHLSYALQWFLFAVVLAVGYPVLVWDTERKAGRLNLIPK